MPAHKLQSLKRPILTNYIVSLLKSNFISLLISLIFPAVSLLDHDCYMYMSSPFINCFMWQLYIND